MGPQKALETIGANLQKQYENWQPRVSARLLPPPVPEERKGLGQAAPGLSPRNPGCRAAPFSAHSSGRASLPAQRQLLRLWRRLCFWEQ